MVFVKLQKLAKHSPKFRNLNLISLCENYVNYFDFNGIQKFGSIRSGSGITEIQNQVSGQVKTGSGIFRSVLA